MQSPRLVAFQLLCGVSASRRHIVLPTLVSSADASWLIRVLRRLSSTYANCFTPGCKRLWRFRALSLWVAHTVLLFHPPRGRIAFDSTRSSCEKPNSAQTCQRAIYGANRDFNLKALYNYLSPPVLLSNIWRFLKVISRSDGVPNIMPALRPILLMVP